MNTIDIQCVPTKSEHRVYTQLYTFNDGTTTTSIPLSRIFSKLIQCEVDTSVNLYHYNKRIMKYSIINHEIIDGDNTSSIYRLYEDDNGTDIKPHFMGVNKTLVITDYILEIARR
jgi:hypothetical protein